jgi:hypothetical protein
MIQDTIRELWVEVDGVAFNLNQSRVQTFLRCHRKYGWQYVEQLVPDRPTYHLSTGTAVHAALAAVKAGKATPEESVQIALETFKDLLPKRKLPGDDEIIAENEEIIQAMVPAYFEHYKHDPEPWKPIGIEVAGRVEVGEGTGVFLVFRTDALVIWRKMLWLVDHKTAKKLDPRDLMKYEMDIQPTAYAYGITKLFAQQGRNMRVSGVIINVLVKTKVPQFAREQYTRTDDELAEFEREFVEIARDMKTRHLRVQAGENWKDVFYKNTNECFSYGTCWFRDLCMHDTPTRRLSFRSREADYVDDPKILDKEKPEHGA